MRIRVACSPDADDLFMMRAITEGLIDTGPYTFEVDTAPTDALNRMASGADSPDSHRSADGAAEVVAISIAHYPAVAGSYQLLPHGGSMGEGYGPVLVANRPMALGDLRGRRVAVPGLTTSAYATLRLAVDVIPVVIPIVPPQRVFDALRAEEVEGALVIHEGRLTFAEQGFAEVLELGRWWAQQTGGLPLPLGGNTIARRLGDHIAPVSDVLRRSIAHGLAHRDDAITWLLARGGVLRTREALDRYLAMYANERTLDYGPDGRAAIAAFFDRCAAAGVLDPVTVDFAP